MLQPPATNGKRPYGTKLLSPVDDITKFLRASLRNSCCARRVSFLCVTNNKAGRSRGDRMGAGYRCRRR